jgi:hypothetical protein
VSSRSPITSAHTTEESWTFLSLSHNNDYYSQPHSTGDHSTSRPNIHDGSCSNWTVRSIKSDKMYFVAGALNKPSYHQNRPF